MFCPHCGVENPIHQAYCSRCGQFLSPLALALDGRLEEIAARLKASEKMFNVANATSGLFVASGLLIIFIGLLSWLATGASPSAGYILTVLSTLSLGAILGLPFTLLGRTRLRGALRDIEESSRADHQTLGGADKQRDQIGVGRPPGFEAQAPSSVTEETTVKLRKPEH